MKNPQTICLGKHSLPDCLRFLCFPYVSATLWLILGLSGSLWVMLGHIGSFRAIWVILGHSESFWVILGHSGSLWVSESSESF